MSNDHHELDQAKRLELILEIAKAAEQSCVDRRIYEWRLNILLWGGVPAMIGFLAKETHIADWGLYVLLVAFIALWALYTFIWQAGVQTGHQTDRTLKTVAINELLTSLDLKKIFDEQVIQINGSTRVIKKNSVEVKPKFSRGKRHWQSVYSAITFLILSISWILLFFVTK